MKDEIFFFDKVLQFLKCNVSDTFQRHFFCGHVLWTLEPKQSTHFEAQDLLISL